MSGSMADDLNFICSRNNKDRIYSIARPWQAQVVLQLELEAQR